MLYNDRDRVKAAMKNIAFDIDLPRLTVLLIAKNLVNYDYFDRQIYLNRESNLEPKICNVSYYN